MRGSAQRFAQRSAHRGSTWTLHRGCRLPGIAAILTLAGLVLVSGCATARAMRAGQTAEQQQDYDRVVLEYSKALRLEPDDVNIRRRLEVAKLRAAKEHFERGRRMATRDRFEEALIEFQAAADLNPTSGEIDTALLETRNKLRTKLAVRREGKTELESLIERMRAVPPPGLDVPRGIVLPDSLVFRSASSRDVFSALGQFAGVNIAFDQSFRESQISIDLRKTTFDEALASVSASTRHFYRVTGAKTITIIPDTPAKRREYEEEVVRTFYLSNADPKEVVDVLRLVIDNRRLSAVSGANAVSVKDTPERIIAAARLISAIDKARAEVIIEVELLEVSRSYLREYGLQIATPGEDGILGAVDANRENLTLSDLRSLTQADIFVTGLPGIVFRALKNDASTRTLASPQLRTSEGMAAQARFGERVPVPVTTFAPIATGGINQQPITSFNYENIGVNIDITPRTHHNDDVSLMVRVEVSSISGTGFGGLPTFGSRQINTNIRLRDGETNILAGLIRDDEREVLAGVPGLVDLPVIGRLFARNRTERAETDIILTLTPHIVRVLDITEADLQPFRIQKDTAGAVMDVPLGQPPQAEPEPPVQTEPPSTAPPGQSAEPVRPPTPPQ